MNPASGRQRSLWRQCLLLAVIPVCIGSCGPQSMPDVQLFKAAEAPPTLSAWGVLLRQRDQLVLNRDVFAYSLNTPLFSDYAQKLRTVWLPPGTRVQYRMDESFDFPVGAIISKTFYYPRAEPGSTALLKHAADPLFDGQGLDLDRVRLIETRLLVHQADGWQALPYVWDEAQRDAHLSIGGAIKVLTLSSGEAPTSETFDYLVPDANQCGGCHVTDHQSGRLSPIGPKARHLNRPINESDGRNQLDDWAARGLLGGLPPDAQRPRNARWPEDTDADLDQRARSYLDINCGHCHSRRGPANTSGLLLDQGEWSLRQLGVCKPPVAAGRGSGGHLYSIVPGEPAQSILSFRMRSRDPGQMMPELGRTLAHSEGVALIERWIASLTGECATGPGLISQLE
ncbi:MAG: hypothetical protein Tsb002_12860 [Wenzhouxiangellaceae bacterium]